ncbi:MbnP family protein [Jejudonia soesokkakensis]|uniref:MbnP family protein n=1 Tax=Jejudonia soesokkakensis TaxID=1323432 RepID=A0ABW2MST6_9FLAO
MKKIIFALSIFIVAISCDTDDSNNTSEDTNVTFRFTQNWDGENIENSDYENTTYVNANGESMTLSKVNYLISDITFTSTIDGTVYAAEDYNLILARNSQNVEFTPNIEIPEGEYTVSFTFGFDDEDNDKVGGYADLNSVDGFWSVPAPLGAGYHFQRIEGTYVNSLSETTSFQFHTVRANRHSSLPPGPGTLEELRDTSFVVNLGGVSIQNNTTIEVKANIAEWFKNPITWDLNTRFMVLMPNFQAQLDMNENGATVFSLGEVTQ